MISTGARWATSPPGRLVIARGSHTRTGEERWDNLISSRVTLVGAPLSMSWRGKGVRIPSCEKPSLKSCMRSLASRRIISLSNGEGEGRGVERDDR